MAVTSLPEPGRLVATTRRLDVDVDLAAVAGEDGALFVHGDVGIATRGAVGRVDVGLGAADVGQVADALARIDRRGDVGPIGTGPVAIGALPFDPRSSGRLLVPELVVARATDGTRWITTIGESGSPEPHLDTPATPPGPRDFEVTPVEDPDDWLDLVTRAKGLLSPEFRKVVLARSVLVDGDADFSRSEVVSALRRSYPSCTVFSVDGFVGASPELLVERRGDVVRSHPLAGTAPRSADPTDDARLAAGLLASAKDQEEHRITIDMVHETLLPWCSYLDEEAEPSIVAMANVQHLGTSVEGRLSDPHPSVLDLVAALHPTPAVGGDPRDRALAAIAELESSDRDRYAGPVGWVDAEGNGTFVVGIRSARIEGRRARLWAGVGVVADSDPVAELAETRAKFQAVLSAVVRP